MRQFSRAFAVARLGGVSIVVDPSWFIIFLFLTWGLAVGYFPGAAPGLPPSSYWLFGAAASFCLFLSVTLHELGHSLVARARGMKVRRIVLFIFGGVSQLEGEPENARTEFYVAVVGPLISFALAAVFWLTRAAVPPGEAPSILRALLGYLAVINVALGVFNLLPGFPLDGGRLLRSYLWSRWKDHRRATKVASQVGSGFGLALMVVGGASILSGNAVGGLWYVLIGFFLRNAAQGSFAQVTMRGLLEGVLIRDIMTPEPVTVLPDLKLDRFVEDFILRHHHPFFPVTEGSRLVGIVGIDAVKKVQRERWSMTRVADVMAQLGDMQTAPPDEPAARTLLRMEGKPGRVLVARGDRLEGIVSRRDLLDYITLKSDLERWGEGARSQEPETGRQKP